MNDVGPSLGIGRILGQTFALIFADRRLWIAGLAFGLAGALLDGAIQARLPDVAPGETMPDLSGGVALVYLLGLAASLVLSAFSNGFLCLMGVDAAIGRSHSIGQYARQALRHVAPLLVISVALTFLIGLGVMLFILPGLYFVGRYLPWIQTVIFEDRGWQGLGRAQELTEGYRWPLAMAAVLFGLVALAVIIAAGVGAYALSDTAAMEIVFNSVAAAFGYAAAAAFTAVAYLRLREIKDGVSPAEIAASIG